MRNSGVTISPFSLLHETISKMFCTHYAWLVRECEKYNERERERARDRQIEP